MNVQISLNIAIKNYKKIFLNFKSDNSLFFNAFDYV